MNHETPTGQRDNAIHWTTISQAERSTMVDLHSLDDRIADAKRMTGIGFIDISRNCRPKRSTGYPSIEMKLEQTLVSSVANVETIGTE